MNILIIAGGTGGHVYPALSIAKEFQDDGNTIFWIGKKDSFCLLYTSDAADE